VAPGAAIVSVKVMGSSGWGTTDDIVAGMEWVVDNKATYGIEVMSLSIGGLVGTSDGTDDMSDAANSAVAAGIVVCAAAANSGPERQTTASPAAAKDVIAVGAMSDPGEGGFFQAYFSSRGPTADQRIKPDVCGPGWNIMAALRNTTSGYQAKYGTSMACPFVAGVCALMLDANPSLTPAQLKSKLTATCQGWGPSGKDVDYGFGRVRAWNAVRAAGGFTTGTSPSAPAHICKVGSLAATGSYDDWTFNVTSTTYPLAATLIMTNGSGSSPNFGLTLYNPAGTAVKTTTTQTRQDYFTYQPAVTGTYKLRIKSTTGAGPYSCDVSGAVVDLTPVPPVKDITAPAAGEQNE